MTSHPAWRNTWRKEHIMWKVFNSKGEQVAQFFNGAIARNVASYFNGYVKYEEGEEWQ
jgi:hypothetical protein